MIGVNDATIKAYTEYGCNKKITISFPDDTSIPAITNKNLQEESMKIMSGICEENNLQVEGCNSMQFEITTFDIQKDLTRKNIEVSLSVKDENYKGEWTGSIVNGIPTYKVGNIVKYNGKYYQCYQNYVPVNSTDKENSISYRTMNAKQCMYNGYLTDDMKAIKVVLPYLMDGLSILVHVVGGGLTKSWKIDNPTYVNYIDLSEYPHGNSIQYVIYLIYDEPKDVIMERIQSVDNIATGKSAAASSRLHSDYLPKEAIDGNCDTRWASASNIEDEPEQWIYVDLGEEKSIYDIAINWAEAFATNYKIQTSTDAETWKDIHSIVVSKSETIDLLFDSKMEAVTARYVRIFCTKPYDYDLGYSIREIGIFDTVPNSVFDFKELMYGAKVTEVLDAKVQLYTIPPDDTRVEEYWQEIYGYLDTSDVNDFIIFRGKIDSFEKQTDPRYKTMIAYDKLYETSNVSTKDWINAVNEYGAGYIEKYNYRGWWVSGTTDYKAGDVVKGLKTIHTGSDGGEVTVVADYRYKRDMNWKNFYGVTPDVLETNSYPSHYADDNGAGDTYIELLNGYTPNRPTIKQLRDDLCAKLGIQQEDVELPLDNVELSIGEFTEDISGLQLLKWICNMNMVFGYIDPASNKLRYIFINKEKQSLTQDSNYVGEFNIETSANEAYQINNVVAVADESGIKTYYKNIMSLSSKLPTKFQMTDITDMYKNVVNATQYKAPSSRNNGWCIDFDFNAEFAKELGVNIIVQTYNANPSKSMTITKPGRIYLADLIGDNLYSSVVNNVNDEFWSTFKATLYTAEGEKASTFYPNNEVVSKFWEKCSPLYHPSGYINLSNLYETGSVTVKDGKFKNAGYKVIDTSNNVVYGPTDDIHNAYLDIIYSPLYSAWKSAQQIYIDVNENVGAAGKYFTIEYAPFALSMLGLPFLEIGDYICFDVTEWSSDENDNPVMETKTIESIVLSRNLSGINALTDELEARNE